MAIAAFALGPIPVRESWTRVWDWGLDMGCGPGATLTPFNFALFLTVFRSGPLHRLVSKSSMQDLFHSSRPFPCALSPGPTQPSPLPSLSVLNGLILFPFPNPSLRGSHKHHFLFPEIWVWIICDCRLRCWRES